MKKFVFILMLLISVLFSISLIASSSENKLTSKDLTFYDRIDIHGNLEGGMLLLSEFYKDIEIDQTIEDYHEYNPDNCKIIRYTGNSSNKLNIIFVASHFYDDLNKFAFDVQRFMREFDEFPQYVDNMDKINFYRVDDIDVNDGCKSIFDNPVCNVERIRNLALQCPFDPENNNQIIILFDEDNIFLRYARAEPQNKMTYMPSMSTNLLMHEFGHSFGGLGDEYDGNWENDVDPEFPNCASSTPGYTCKDKWGDLIGVDGVDCFNICGALNWFRPTISNSVMRNPNLDHFCAVSERHVDNLFSVYSDEISSCVTLFDILRNSFMSKLGDNNFDARADLNNDNKVNILDIAIFSLNFEDYENEVWCTDNIN